MNSWKKSYGDLGLSNSGPSASGTGMDKCTQADLEAMTPTDTPETGRYQEEVSETED